MITTFTFVGIRSQSKPLDIMHEVFKAMKSLGYVSSNINVMLGLHLIVMLLEDHLKVLCMVCECGPYETAVLHLIQAYGTKYLYIF